MYTCDRLTLTRVYEFVVTVEIYFQDNSSRVLFSVPADLQLSVICLFSAQAPISHRD